jgi:dynein regulatory complex protein 1
MMFALSQVVDDEKWSVWCRLETQLEAYHRLLLGRSEALADVGSLSQQNEELRALLNQYLGSKINGDLKVPPTALL